MSFNNFAKFSEFHLRKTLKIHVSNVEIIFKLFEMRFLQLICTSVDLINLFMRQGNGLNFV